MAEPTEAEKQQVLAAQQKLDDLQRAAGAPNPGGSPQYIASIPKDSPNYRAYQNWLKSTAEAKEKIPQAQAEYDTLISKAELAAYAKDHPATRQEVQRYATSQTGYDPASQPDRARNKADIDVRRVELIKNIAQSNPSYSIADIDRAYNERSGALLPQNVTIDYEGTLKAREMGYNVGSGLTRGLPETFQKEEDRRFGERNKIISLTESLGGPKPKTDYYVGLTEGSGNKAYTVNLEEGGAQAARSKEFAVSLSEGAPRKPKELSETQVAKLSEREYAVYAAEFAPYNEWVKQENETARVQGLANWKEFKGDIKEDVADLKKQGVKFVTIKSDSGYETVPIDKAVNRIVRGKNVTSIAAVPEIPKGFTVAGSPQELVLVEEDKRKYAGPDQAYSGEFKDPRKGTSQGGLLEKAASVGSSLFGGLAQTGVTIMSGLVGASQSVKSFADEITGNATVTNQTKSVIPPTDLEQAPVSQPESAPLSATVPTQTSSQKAVAAMGGGVSAQERNVGMLRQSLDQIVAASNRRDVKRFGEDPFTFALKEQKKQAPLETIRDFGEGVGTGFTRASVLLTATAPQAVIDQIQTGDFSEKATLARFQKDEEDLRKLGVGPSVIGEALSGRGTGRSPAYNIGEAIGEVGTGFLVGGSPKAPKIGRSGVPMTGFTKARILTKLQAADNIYGVERAVSPKATGFVSKRFVLKPKEKKTNQFIGSIGTEEARTQFNPLTKETVGEPAPTFGIGAKGEKITQNVPKETVITSKGEPSDTPALIIDTDKGGLTGVVRAQPREAVPNQMGIIVRGDVTPTNMKRLGLKQISTDDKGVPVFAARLPKGAKKREKFLSTLSEAEELGFIKRVTDIDFIPTDRALGIAKGEIGGGKFPERIKGDINKPVKTSRSDILDKIGYKIETGISKIPQVGKGDYLVGADVGFAKKIITPGFSKTAMFTHPLKPEKIFIARPGNITPKQTEKVIGHETLHNLLGKMGEFEASEKLDIIEYGSAKGDVIKKIIPEAYNEGRLGKENTIDILLNLSDDVIIQNEKNFLARPRYVPRKEPVKIEYEKSKGRKDIRFGERKDSYGPRQIRNEFQTAKYYETTVSKGTARELRIKGTTEGKTVYDAFEAGTIPKGKPKFEDEFGLTGMDEGLERVGLDPKLKPKAEKGMKTFEDFSKPIEQGKGGAGRGGKLEPISQEKALDIAGSIKPLTQGVKTTESPIRPEYGTAYTGASSAYEFETEITGKYSISPIGATEPRLDIKIRDVFDTKSGVSLAQRDLIAEGSKQVQPTITQNLIRTDSITKSGLKEDEKLKNRLLDKLVFRNDAKQTPRTQTRLQTGQQLKQTPIQKQIQQVVPKVPFKPPPTRPPRAPPRVPTFRIPEIEKRKKKREKDEAKEKVGFFGNVPQENVGAAGYKKYDIRYGKRADREAAKDLTKGRKGREVFVTNRSDSFLSKKDNMFTEKKPKRVGKSGFAKAGKKYRW